MSKAYKNEYLRFYHFVKKNGRLIGYTFQNLKTYKYEYRTLEELPNYIENVEGGRISSRGYLTIEGVQIQHRKVDSLSTVEKYCNPNIYV